MTKTALALSLLMLILAASCAGAMDATSTKVSYPEPDDYAVSSALIEERFVSSGNWTAPILVRDYTTYPEIDIDEKGFLEALPGLKEETVSSFNDRNSMNYALDRRLKLSVDYSLVNENDDPGAENIVGLSLAGFDADRTQALIHIDEIRYWYVSIGYLILLTREDDGWAVSESITTYAGE